MQADLIISGHRAGRIQPEGWDPPSNFCFLLGSDDALVSDDVIAGQVVSVGAAGVDLTDVTFLGFAFRFRQSSTDEGVSGLRCTAFVSVGGTECWSCCPATGEAEQFMRRWINVASLSGDNQIDFGLKIEAVP